MTRHTRRDLLRLACCSGAGASLVKARAVGSYDQVSWSSPLSLPPPKRPLIHQRSFPS